MTERTWSEVGQLLRQHRERLGWLQEDVVSRAKDAGVKMSLSNYRVFEGGGRESYRPITLRGIELGFDLPYGSLDRLKAGGTMLEVLEQQDTDSLRTARYTRQVAEDDASLERVTRSGPQALLDLLTDIFWRLDPDRQKGLVDHAQTALRRHSFAQEQFAVAAEKGELDTVVEDVVDRRQAGDTPIEEGPP